ncbi:hypothetical protein [Hydrocarboniphaga sp.]|uniref:hypothetical protein n=1 Tax=Hydrocarboniphaga sp. TaxID=2033016 RepID=UPI003D1075F9
MNKHITLVAVALWSAALALPATAAEPLGSKWSDVTKLPDFFTGNWESRESFLDSSASAVPYTAQAQAYVDRYKAIEDIPFAGPGCKTPGMPIVQRLGSPLKFFYQPGMIAIYIENSSMTRFIRLNAKHSAQPNPTFLGESVGHFEGDTLVVDTIGFDEILLQYGTLPGKVTGPFVLPPDAIFGPHGPNLRMVERIRLLDADTLEDQLTIYDDTVWKRPFVSNAGRIFKRNRGENGMPHEWVCNTDDTLTFDPSQNKTVTEDPAEVLKRLQQKDKN